MQDRIRQYVESHFDGAKMSRETEELKEELILNLVEKYNDLLSQGKSPEAAYEEVIAGIGDLDEMLKGLGAKREQRYYSPSAPMPSEKKSHTLRNVLLCIFGILAFFIILAMMFGRITEGTVVPQVVDALSNIAWEEDWDEEGGIVYEQEYSIPAEGVDSLDVNWAAGRISIELWEGEELWLYESCSRDLDSAHRLSYRLRDGELEIKSLELSAAYNKSLIIQIPSSLSLEELSVNTASGNLSIGGVSAKDTDLNSAAGKIELTGLSGSRLSVESASGGIYLSDCSIEWVKVQCLTGRVDIEGSFDRVEIEGVSGGVSVISQVCPSYFDAEVVTGSVSLTIPDNSGFSVSTEGITAKVDSDFPLEYQSRAAVYGDGSAQFKVEGINGSFRIIRAAAEEAQF